MLLYKIPVETNRHILIYKACPFNRQVIPYFQQNRDFFSSGEMSGKWSGINAFQFAYPLLLHQLKHTRWSAIVTHNK